MSKVLDPIEFEIPIDPWPEYKIKYTIILVNITKNIHKSTIIFKYLVLQQ